MHDLSAIYANVAADIAERSEMIRQHNPDAVFNDPLYEFCHMPFDAQPTKALGGGWYLRNHNYVVYAEFWIYGNELVIVNDD